MKSFPYLHRSILFLLSILLAGCLCGKKTGELEVVRGQEFNLPLGKTALLKDGGLELTFTEVLEDSRCPLYTNCIWEGQVRVKIEVKQAGDTVAVEFTRKGQETEPLIEVVDGLKLTVLSVNPYPESGKSYKPADYSVRMLID
jgi:hypothetical protein